MKNLIRKIKNLSRIQMHFVWFYLAAFLLSALVLLYAPWSDVFLMKSNLTEPLSDRIAIRDYIKDYYLRTRSAEDAPSILRWFPVSLNGHTFLISIASYEHTYVASWYRIETILSPLTSLKDSEHISYYLSDTKK